jgi:hypothetical protein
MQYRRGGPGPGEYGANEDRVPLTRKSLIRTECCGIKSSSDNPHPHRISTITRLDDKNDSYG